MTTPTPEAKNSEGAGVSGTPQNPPAAKAACPVLRGTDPASGEEIVSHFRSYDHDAMWAENWTQGIVKQDPTVPGTSTTIQGVLCCVDQDVTISWLLMLCDCESGSADWTVSYLATAFGSWRWAWIHADDNLHACAEFVTWVTLNEEILDRSGRDNAEGPIKIAIRDSEPWRQTDGNPIRMVDGEPEDRWKQDITESPSPEQLGRRV